MTVDFRSMLGFIGDLFAGWKRVPKHLNQQGQVQGWFRRGMGGYLIMASSSPRPACCGPSRSSGKWFCA